MKTLKNFKDNQIECSIFNGGGALVPIDTPPGIVQGMAFGSDQFFDSDHDHQWGSGETVTFFFNDMREQRG
ncbi:hypothetical protein [Polaribacter sp. IC073]|uniref:hypothetical protein n=1 Tax=Polaribacter sp. IC073 TaxID=2508540 RepID=UPI0011BE0503|nr:hypothetical protein [Polaribacter sp. IC073]TXD49761.1 hypothetical protein ES045_00830 [Polaribacter sp. IC073]